MQRNNLTFYHSEGPLLIKFSAFTGDPRWSSYGPGLVLIAIMAMLQILPQPWPDLIRYDRVGVDSGELWRVVSGNFIHLTWGHFVLNAVGLIFIMAIFADGWGIADWAAQLTVCSFTVGAGLHYLSLDIFWCVGLSGVLHGMFVYGAVGLALKRESVAKWMIVGVSAKLLWEGMIGELPMTANISGGSVVTDAHLWGAIGGLAAVGTLTIWRRV